MVKRIQNHYILITMRCRDGDWFMIQSKAECVGLRVIVRSVPHTFEAKSKLIKNDNYKAPTPL